MRRRSDGRGQVASSYVRCRWCIVLGAVIVPYLARLPGTVFHGLGWLQQYLPAELLGEGLLALAVLLILNSLPGVILAAVSYRLPRPWFAVPAALTALGLSTVHGTLDLRSDAQAPVALVFIPIYASAFALATSALTGICFVLTPKASKQDDSG